jgi:integrase
VIPTVPRFPKVETPPEPAWKWASEEQQDDIFNHLDPNDFYFIAFQACHGTRTGETRALRHSDIDVEMDTVTIRRAFSGTVLREITKTKRIRRIPLDPGWKELYQSQPRSLDPEAFVFLRNGKPFSESWARKKWNEARIKAGLTPITLYEGTRHSIASQAVNRGVSLYAISRFLGHTNIKQTEKYSHIETNALQQVQRKGTLLRPIFSNLSVKRKSSS